MEVVVGSAPELKTTVVLVDVGGDAAAVVLGRCLAVEHLTGAGVTKVESVWIMLVWLKIFQTWTVGIQVAQVVGVAMAKAGGVEQGAVVVHRCTTEHDLVATVTIYVAHTHAVASFAVAGVSVRTIAGVLAVGLRRGFPVLVLHAHRLVRGR